MNNFSRSKELDVAAPPFDQHAGLECVSQHVILGAVLDVTRFHLRSRGKGGHEGALCWAGVVKGNVAIVTTAILFSASGDYGVHIPAAQTGLLYAHCYARSLTLFAQVHSHPGTAYHSSIDEKSPHSAEPGFLSVVAPNFGHCSYVDFTAWAIFEQVRYETWRRWEHAEKGRRLHLLASVVEVP